MYHFSHQWQVHQLQLPPLHVSKQAFKHLFLVCYRIYKFCSFCFLFEYRHSDLCWRLTLCVNTRGTSVHCLVKQLHTSARHEVKLGINRKKIVTRRREQKFLSIAVATGPHVKIVAACLCLLSSPHTAPLSLQRTHLVATVNVQHHTYSSNALFHFSASKSWGHKILSQL